MATTTATIFIGSAHPNHSGINPTHLIRLTENSRPALLLQPLQGQESVKVVIPTLENIVDDIYLMIAVYILQKVTPTKEIHTAKRTSLYDIFHEKERLSLYAETRKVIEATEIKVVFNILDDSHLLTQLDAIKNYPSDFEVTLPAFKNEFNSWANRTITKGL